MGLKLAVSFDSCLHPVPTRIRTTASKQTLKKCEVVDDGLSLRCERFVFMQAFIRQIRAEAVIEKSVHEIKRINCMEALDLISQRVGYRTEGGVGLLRKVGAHSRT